MQPASRISDCRTCQKTLGGWIKTLPLRRLSEREENLLRDRSAKDLCSEEAALRSLDDLLIDGRGWVVHYHRAFPVVDFGVNAGVADEIYYPLFTFVL
jgi:hypothetical protein